jgi:hypothetical protein
VLLNQDLSFFLEHLIISLLIHHVQAARNTKLKVECDFKCSKVAQCTFIKCCVVKPVLSSGKETNSGANILLIYFDVFPLLHFYSFIFTVNE